MAGQIRASKTRDAETEAIGPRRRFQVRLQVNDKLTRPESLKLRQRADKEVPGAMAG